MGRAQEVERGGRLLDWAQPRDLQRGTSPFPVSVSPSWEMQTATISPSEAFARKKRDDLEKHLSSVRLGARAKEAGVQGRDSTYKDVGVALSTVRRDQPATTGGWEARQSIMSVKGQVRSMDRIH